MPYSGSGDCDVARHLVLGLALPDISLPSTLGGSLNLSALPGAAVIFFYPWTGRPGFADPPGWDDIPGAHGSTPETEGFRDEYPGFQDIKVAVHGVSTQASEHHRELAGRLDIPFAILSDEAFVLQKALNLPTFEAGGIAYLKRLTLVVREGRIEKFFYPVAKPGGHARAVLAWLTRSGISDLA